MLIEINCIVTESWELEWGQVSLGILIPLEYGVLYPLLQFKQVGGLTPAVQALLMIY